MEMHDPITCEYLKLWKIKCDDDSETSNWIHVNTKVCYEACDFVHVFFMLLAGVSKVSCNN